MMTLRDDRSPANRRHPEPLLRRIVGDAAVIDFGLAPPCRDALNDAFSGQVMRFDTIDSLRGAPTFLAKPCVFVGTDTSDLQAMLRLEVACEHFSKYSGANIVAVSSFFPGAYGDYLMSIGATMYVTELKFLSLCGSS